MTEAGNGIADAAPIIRPLDAAGRRGFYDLELFSDDGTFGIDHDGSLWAVPTRELAARGRAALVSVCAAAAG